MHHVNFLLFLKLKTDIEIRAYGILSEYFRKTFNREPENGWHFEGLSYDNERLTYSYGDGSDSLSLPANLLYEGWENQL